MSNPKPKSAAPAVSGKKQSGRNQRSRRPGPKPKKDGKARARHAYLQMMVDPLNAPTAQRPDYNDAPTIIRRCIDAVQVTPTAQGFFLFNVLPFVNASHTSATLDVGGTVTALGTNQAMSDYAAMSTEYTQCRCLVTVVEVIYVGPEQTGSGYVNVVQVPVASIVADTVASYIDEPGSSGRLPGGVVFIKRHHADTTFVSLGAINTTPTSIFAVAITGAAATTNSVMIKITRIMEFTPAYGKLSFSMSSSTPVDMSVVHAAANITGPGATYGSGPDGYDEAVKHAHRLAGFAEVLYDIGNSRAGAWAAEAIQGLL